MKTDVIKEFFLPHIKDMDEARRLARHKARLDGCEVLDTICVVPTPKGATVMLLVRERE